MAFGAVAHADDWNQQTTITVNQPIEVPGAVLPAGTYTFKLMDSDSNRHIVEVLNQRQDHLYATIVAVPNYQIVPQAHTVFTFYEVAAGQPQPVRAWFYPGENYGQEFMYSKEEMQRLTAKKTETVLAAATPEPAPPVAQAAPAPAPAPPPAAQPAPEPAPQVAQNETPAPPPSVETPAPTRPVMPQTASNIPLLALLGLVSVFAAAGLSIFAKRLS
jgi:pyruvate/2-oxoglutarate dehydrogenase complex dihydrolipoamide acyltransferase (E2) component